MSLPFLNRLEKLFYCRYWYKKSFISDDYSLEVQVYPTDMNNDGKEEFF